MRKEVDQQIAQATLCLQRTVPTSSSHEWIEMSNGNMARKPASNGENTHLPISDDFKPLLNAIVKFNKQKNKIKKK